MRNRFIDRNISLQAIIRYDSMRSYFFQLTTQICYITEAETAKGFNWQQ